MNRHEEIFFSLLRRALWGTPAEVPADFSGWRDVIILAKSQSVLGLVGNVLITDYSSRLPAKTLDKLKSFVMANMMMHEKQDRVLAKSVRAFNAAGISPVLLKGRGLAQYYPQPNLRQCGDLDMYVGHGNYSAAYEVLRPISDTIDDIRTLSVGIHFDANVGGTDIEVHRYTETYPTKRLNSIYQKASDKGMSEGLVPMKVLDVEVDTPSDVFNAFYVFSHMFRHFLFEGIGFRQICDWMMFLHARRDRIDVDRLRGLIVSMDLMLPWQVFGCLLVNVTGLPEDDFPMYDPKYGDRVGEIVRRILDEGNFGKQRDVFTKKGEGWLRNKMRSFAARIRRTCQLFSIFPKHAFRQLWHTLAESFERGWTELKLKS